MKRLILPLFIILYLGSFSQPTGNFKYLNVSNYSKFRGATYHYDSTYFPGNTQIPFLSVGEPFGWGITTQKTTGRLSRFSWTQLIDSTGVWDTTGTYVHLKNNSWDVGIGTATPSEKLDVVGNLEVNGTGDSKFTTGGNNLLLIDHSNEWVGITENGIEVASPNFTNFFVSYDPSGVSKLWNSLFSGYNYLNSYGSWGKITEGTQVYIDTSDARTDLLFPDWGDWILASNIASGTFKITITSYPYEDSGDKSTLFGQMVVLFDCHYKCTGGGEYLITDDSITIFAYGNINDSIFVASPQLSATYDSLLIPIYSRVSGLGAGEQIYITASADFFHGAGINEYYGWAKQMVYTPSIDHTWPDKYNIPFTHDYGLGSTFVGDSSGNHTLTGVFNTSIGEKTGKSLSSGNSNFFGGYNSGAKTTTGSSNVFVGGSSGENNTTGYSNVFIGVSSGSSNTDQPNNVHIGASAGSSSDEDNNTYIGSGAGSSNSGGEKNVFIGSGAGSSSSGDSCIFIGYQAGANEAGSQKLYIENTSSASPLIYGDFQTDEITINGELEGDSIFAPNLGYALNIGYVGTGNPADATTYYYGMMSNRNFAETSADELRVYFPIDGKITSAQIFWNAITTAGSNEDISIYIRINNSTDYLIETIGDVNNKKHFNNESLDIDISAGDYFEIKVVTPSWITNPVGVRMGGNIFVSSQRP